MANREELIETRSKEFAAEMFTRGDGARATHLKLYDGDLHLAGWGLFPFKDKVKDFALSLLSDPAAIPPEVKRKIVEDAFEKACGHDFDLYECF